MKLSPHSFLAGAATALGVLLLSGADGTPDPTVAPDPTACQCCGCRADYGRYALTFSGSRAYLLDRETGQVWEKYAPANAVGSSADFNDPKQ